MATFANNPLFGLGIGLLSQPTLGSGLQAGLLNAQRAQQQGLQGQLLNLQIQQQQNKQRALQQLASILSGQPSNAPLSGIEGPPTLPQAQARGLKQLPGLLVNAGQTGAALGLLGIGQKPTSPFGKIDPSKFTQESIQRFSQTRNFGDLVAAPKSPLVSIENKLPSFNAAAKALGTKGIDTVFAEREKAADAAKILQSNNEALNLLDQGTVTGFGADFKVGFGRALQAAGINFAQDPVDNAQAFSAIAAERVGKIIKQFGSGTGLSDADREFAEKAAAGKITMTEGALRRILEINNKASINIIKNFNGLVDKIKPSVRNASPFPLKIDIPTFKKKTPPIPQGFVPLP